MNKNYKNIEELNAFVQQKKVGHVFIGYHNVQDYAGIVLAIGFVFDFEKSHYELDFQWISFGLDLTGENLLENYLYKFDSLQKLLAYLHTNYDIKITDIPIKYKIDSSLFPNPIKDADQKPVFEIAWQKFQADFKKGIFLDAALPLLFSSNEVD